MRRPRALMACVHAWGSPLQVGSRHLARCLLRRGWDVAYVSAPLTPLHLLKAGRDDVALRFRLWRAGGRWQEPQTPGAGRLCAMVPAALLAPDARPLLRSQMLLRHWQRLSLPPVAGMLRRRGFGSVDLLYLDNFFHSFWLDAVTSRRSVYRMTDVHAGFPGHCAAFSRVEAQVAARVDRVAYPAQTMAPLVARLAPGRGLFLSNGVDLARFEGPLPAEPAVLAGVPRPRAVFVGALERWVDAALLARTARELPWAQVVCIGPRSRPLPELEGLANVHLLGELQPDVAAGCLRHCQAGLLPFDVAGHGALVAPLRPLKLFEYLAAGLPAVALRWQELEAMAAPALMCDDATGFVAATAAALTRPHDPEAGRRFAAAHDWERACQALLQELGLEDAAESYGAGMS